MRAAPVARGGCGRYPPPMLMHIARFAVLVAAFWVMPKIIPGVRMKKESTALAAALVFTLLNFLVGWLLKFMLVVGTLGIAFLALNFLANAVLLWITDKVMDDLEVDGIGAILLSAGLVTVANALAHHFIW